MHTVYISISEVNGFSTGVATFANNYFPPRKWTQLPDEVKSLPALTAGNGISLGLLLISCIKHTHVHIHVTEYTNVEIIQ